MNIIHIGLGKTATSTWQKFIFPLIAENRNLKFNDSRFTSLLRKFILTDLNSKQKTYFQKILGEEGNIISNENLIGWNPRLWEANADKNKELFGSNNIILISLPISTSEYLNSIYIHKIQSSVIVEPNDLYLNKYEYDKYKKSNGDLERVFDVDSFDLNFLINLYSERFENVVTYNPMSVNQIGPLFKLSSEEIETIKNIIKTKKSNKSFSKLAIWLTIMKEKILNKINLCSNKRNLNLVKLIREEELLLPKRSHNFKNVTKIKKIFLYPIKSLKTLFSWNFFIRNIFDRLIPYKKYRITEDFYRNLELEKSNDRVIAKHRT